MISIKLFLLTALIAGVATGAQAASTDVGQDYPSRPIRFVVSQAAGGGSDVAARIIAQKVRDAWSQQVVVDNRPGATNIIGANIVAKSEPDGYTWLFAGVTTLAIVPNLYKKLPFNPVKDFTPVVMLVKQPYVLVVSNSLPVKNVPELVALAKAKPGGLLYASAGSGGANHLLAVMFNSLANVNMVHVPYRGSVAALIDLMSGQVQLYFAGIAAVLPQVNSGAVRAIAVTSAKRSSALKNVPTIAESGFPGFDSNIWFGIVVPAGTPAAVIKKINTSVNGVLAQTDMIERLANIGFEPYANTTPEQFAKVLQGDTIRWAKTVKESGATLD